MENHRDRDGRCVLTPAPTSIGGGLFFSLLLAMGLIISPSLRAQTPPDADNDGVVDATDVDDDNDSLIEISTLAQLNHMRYDLAGSSYKASAEAAGDTRGCPQNGCHGYELMADLDFRKGCGAVGTAASACTYSDWVPQDSNGNIAVPADGTNAGWPPIGDDTNAFTGTFDGNGHIIKNLYIDSNNNNEMFVYTVGLFDYMKDGGVIQNVGLTGEHMLVKVSENTSGRSVHAGGLVGELYQFSGSIRNCYATGTVMAEHKGSSGASFAYAGGLVGSLESGTISMSNCYSTGNVTAISASTINTSAPTSYAGGLVGNSTGTASVNSCYATGNVTSTASAVGKAAAGGLVGDNVGSTINDSYYSGAVKKGTTGSLADVAQVAVQYKTAAQLKDPTGPAGIYADWSTQNWDFGSASQLPLLRAYRENSGGSQVQGQLIAGQLPIVDKDGDGLIEIGTLAELDHVRFNLAGTSYKTSSADSGDTRGCPQSGCYGYELVANLDFREGCGEVGTVASACDYPNWVPKDGSGNLVAPSSGTNAGWTPIPTEGSFSGTFDGNGYAIYNLYIHVRATEGVKAGLFGDVHGGTIRNVGLTGEHMFVSASTTSGDAWVGSLLGYAVHSTIRNCYATGDVSATTTEARAETSAGGLFGEATFDVTIINCYTTGDVTVTGAGTVYAGGLSGDSQRSTIRNCYATGDMETTGSHRVAGGLAGISVGTTTTNSYHSGVLPTVLDLDFGAGTAKTITQLKAPTGAEGIYAAWSEKDWFFGTGAQLPALRTYKEVNGVQVEGQLMKGQSVAHAREAMAGPRYALSHATSASFTLTGSAVPMGLTRRFFVSQSTLASLSIEGGVVDTEGYANLFDFELVGDGTEGASVQVGAGGTYTGAQALTANTNYFVRVLDFRASEVSSRLSPEVSVWTLPSAPTGYETFTKTDTSVSFSNGGALPEGLTRRYFWSTSESVVFPGGTPMADGAGMVEELTGVSDPESVTFTGLQQKTVYYFYFVDSRRLPVLVSAALRRGPISTLATPDPDAPVYTLGTPTQTTLPLTEGSAFKGVMDRRRFYVSKNDLTKLVVKDVKEGTSSGVEGEVWTFVLNEDITEVTMGSGTPPENKPLEVGTRYYVRVMDYEHATGKKSALSDDLGGTTVSVFPVATLGLQKSVLYAYPNPTSGFLHVPVSEGVAKVYGLDGVGVGTFVVSDGRIDLSDLPAGTYIVRLPEHELRVVKQ